uniref:Uncharacterized protein n=1 Tax=Rhizophora mucronata TaxID=61149 RepID=A0A2P2L136_RHIMU
MEIGATSARFCISQQTSCFLWKFQRLNDENGHKMLHHSVAGPNIRMDCPRLACSYVVAANKHWMSKVFCRTNATPASLEESSSLKSENYSPDEENASTGSPEDLLAQPLTSDEVSPHLHYYHGVSSTK